MSFFSFELDPALAADPVFELHQRGKMAINATVPMTNAATMRNTEIQAPA